jgi:hypothetical protein
MKFKEYIYKYMYNIYSIAIVVLANPWGIRGESVGDPWRIRGGSVGDPWRVRGGSVGDPWGIRGGSVAGSWGIRGGSVGDPWGIRGGSVAGSWGILALFENPLVLRDFLAFGGVFWTSLGWAFALTSSWSKLASGGCPSQGQN